MRYCNESLFRGQLEFLRRQFLQDGGLPFTDVLSRETVEQAFDKIEFAWNERIDTPLVTLWVFLGQEDVHLVKWPKPSRRRSLDRDLYNSMPEYLTVREARVRIEHPGFRTKSMVIVTTLLDPVEYTKLEAKFGGYSPVKANWQ